MILDIARGRWQAQQLRDLLGDGIIHARPRLRGRARDYESRYRSSLEALVARMRAAGMLVEERGPAIIYCGPLRARVVAEEWQEPDPQVLLAVERACGQDPQILERAYGPEGRRAYVRLPGGLGADLGTMGRSVWVRVNATPDTPSLWLGEAPGRWGAWSPCDRPVTWRWASMLTAALRAEPVQLTPPLAFADTSAWRAWYDVRSFVWQGYDDDGRYSSSRLYVVAPRGRPQWTTDGWVGELRIVAAVVAEDAGDVDVPTGVIRAPRALGPWIAQRLALERWEVEVAAEELAR